ncbi:hypothetical protein TRICHSKD4_0771 [Roseibium sp. TrichSKD4]|nr:hypothetical protein TRICHSKD4_0771 [Roseibium sp. TrichSKD4]
MTLQTTKPTQMRLHSCVLSQPKRDKVHEKLKNRAYVTVKIDNRPDNAAVRVANVRENGQPRRNTQLLGKYPLNAIAGRSPLPDLSRVLKNYAFWYASDSTSAPRSRHVRVQSYQEY